MKSTDKTSRKWRLLALVGGVAVLALIAHESSHAEVWLDPDQTVTFGATIYDGGFAIDEDPDDPEVMGDRAYESLQVTRGPLVEGTFAVTPEITSTFVNDLLSARMMVADDSNANGHIEWSEWQVVAVAAVTTTAGVSTATFPTVTVSATKDAYRIEIDSISNGLHGQTTCARTMTWDREP